MTTTRFSRIRRAAANPLACACAATLAATLPTAAQTTTFEQASGFDSLWSTVENWTDGVPTPSSDVILSAGEWSEISGADPDAATVTFGEDHVVTIYEGNQLNVHGSAGVVLGHGSSIEGFSGQGWLATPRLHSLGNATVSAGVTIVAGQSSLTISQALGGTLELSGTVSLPAGSTLSFDAQTDADTTFSRIDVHGGISGDPGDADTVVEFRGGGVTTLHAAGDYRGTTRVLGGTTAIGENSFIRSGGLYLLHDAETGASATGTSTVEVIWNGEDYGILTGDGRIGGDLHLMGGLLRPGAEESVVGTLTVDGNFTAEYGVARDEFGDITGSFVGDLEIDLDPENVEGHGTADLLLLTNPDASVSLDGTSLDLLLKSAPAPGQMLRILDAPSTVSITGSFLGWAPGAVGTAEFGGETYAFAISYGAGFIDLIAVPEPSTAALLAGLATVVALIVRRRHARHHAGVTP